MLLELIKPQLINIILNDIDKIALGRYFIAMTKLEREIKWNWNGTQNEPNAPNNVL